LGVIHYYWLVKSDHRKPLEYAVIVGILLAYRLGMWIYGRTQRYGPGGAVRPEPFTAETA
jgi:DMSO/TMAO reductase YedYZ heme-binding membrane subunit